MIMVLTLIQKYFYHCLIHQSVIHNLSYLKMNAFQCNRLVNYLMIIFQQIYYYYELIIEMIYLQMIFVYDYDYDYDNLYMILVNSIKQQISVDYYDYFSYLMDVVNKYVVIEALFINFLYYYRVLFILCQLIRYELSFFHYFISFKVNSKMVLNIFVIVIMYLMGLFLN